MSIRLLVIAFASFSLSILQLSTFHVSIRMNGYFKSIIYFYPSNNSSVDLFSVPPNKSEIRFVIPCSSNSSGWNISCRQDRSPRVTARIVSKEFVGGVKVVGISRNSIGKFGFLQNINKIQWKASHFINVMSRLILQFKSPIY